MCKANVGGGLTTIEEKSLGAIHKSGSRPIKGVLENSNRLLEKVPEGGGFYLQDATHIEPMSMSFMAAAGLAILPTLAAAWFMQRYIIRGLTFGAVKG